MLEPNGSPDQLAGLLQEHEELIQLFIHEDSMAWQLNLSFLGMNGVFIAATYALRAFESDAAVSPLLYIVLLAAAFLNLSTFFTFERSKIHRNARLFRLYHVEDELKMLGIQVQTISTAERLIHKGATLNPDGASTRTLAWYEKKEPLELRRFACGLPLIWVGLAIWILCNRPGL